MADCMAKRWRGMSSRMQKWEYTWCVVQWAVGGLLSSAHYELKLEKKVLKDSQVWAYVDDLGSKGWEMVSTNYQDRGNYGHSYMLWFKRPVG